MEDRIILDDPDYNQNQQVVIQDYKAKKLWILLGVIAAILIVIVIVIAQSSNNHKLNGVIL